MSNIHRLPAPASPPAPQLSLTPELRAWASDHGITRLDDRLEHFLDYCANRAQPYRDMAAAFRNACRSDWAKLGPPQPKPRCVRCSRPTTSFMRRQDGIVCDTCDRQSG